MVRYSIAKSLCSLGQSAIQAAAHRCLLLSAVAVVALSVALSVAPLAAAQPTTLPLSQRPLPAPRAGVPKRGDVCFVDPVRGADANDGSIQSPWRSLQHSVNQLRPGETLYLRGGVYYETVHLTRSGLSGNPIAIMAYPGELPVLDGGLRDFAESPSTSWAPATDGAADEYISTATYPEANNRRVPHQFLPGSWEPMWGKEEIRPLALGHFANSMIPLHGYRTIADLRSSNEFQPKNKNEGALYCGPGLWYNRKTHRIHIRLAHNTLPGLGVRAYQGETDPRKLRLCVAAGFGDDVLRLNGIKHVRIAGLVLRGATGSPMIHVYGSEDVQLDHLTVYGGFPALLINASQKVRVTHSAFRGLAAPWTGRSHMKYHGTASYQIVLQNNQPVNEDIEFGYCEFTDDHDFAFFRYVKNLNFHHNYVDNFNDDGLECGAKLRWHRMHIYRNHLGACLGVFQQHEIDKDESPATHDPDTGLYIFRNIIDQRGGVYYGLPSEPDPSGAFLRHEGAIVNDHGSPIYPVMRVYHNTFLRRGPVWRSHFLFGLGARALRNTERDVFNNLFVQSTGLPGLAINGKVAGALREGGNLLWGLDAEPSELAEPFGKIRNSPIFASSKSVYAPGWTTLDLIGNPRLVHLTSNPAAICDLRLSSDSPAVDRGVPLPKSWPTGLVSPDKGLPDIGAVHLGEQDWAIGIDRRLSAFSPPKTPYRNHGPPNKP